MTPLNELIKQYIVKSSSECFVFFSTDDAVGVELTQFKEQFKAHLHGVMRHVIIFHKLNLPSAIFIVVIQSGNAHWSVD